MWKEQIQKTKKPPPDYPPPDPSKNEPEPEKVPVSRIVPIRELRERRRELLRKAQEDATEED